MTTQIHPTIDTPIGPVPGDAPRWYRQRHSQLPSHRYRDIHDRVDVPVTERHWPQARIDRAPLWVPVDLRDGNQALAEPMDPDRKMRFFTMLVAMGYKEIEVGYPSASKADFDFVRMLADTGSVPADVTPVVFTPARRDLIARTVDSVRGMDNEVVIHLYTATAPMWRDTVLGKDAAAVRELILAGARDVLEFATDLPRVRFQFSPEVFNQTEPGYVLEICDSVTELWQATPQRPVTLNLPATVEIATPNVYADQIEYMHRNLARRDGVILSVHPHNDRGTGVACAELAVLAGAQRVEGCVFGNGERTGNVDIATLALNLHAQGVDPMIDFSDIDEIRRTVEYCTRLPVHPRHPYVGDLVHTAFSGTHQDAIKKGFAEHRSRAAATGRAEREIEWRIPYLPIDPADIGRSYDAVVRVNSQSGKGGIAYLLATEHGLDLPRRLQIDFAGRVQRHVDGTGGEVSAAELRVLFDAAYIDAAEPPDVVLKDIRVTGSAAAPAVAVALVVDGRARRSEHDGADPVDAVVSALAAAGRDIEVLGLAGHRVADHAIAYLEYRRAGESGWSCARGESVESAGVAAAVRAAAGSCPA
ncbi:2-isopropylmalate synthase [Nocardia sp. NBC_01329]|uniref:2-isopropylmalate synthase n=1 Tax=Nocardia sp. NBC_01329 TaxID=2903594 RepID=UPI002E144616|nr:2-isopropylmalate synthase [Nocardia sp. NBC_01329]